MAPEEDKTSAAELPRLAVSLPNMAEPDRLIELGTRAEAKGWDGVFVWDHVHGSPEMPVPMSDPWIVLGVGLGEPPDEYLAYGESADPRHLAERVDEGLEVVTGLWSGERFDHHGTHFTVENAQYLPTPVQRPRIPVWAGCTVPHTRPLRRAARWDGLILAAVTESGSIEAPAPEEVRRAREEIARHRPDDAPPLAVAVSHSGPPTDEDLAVYAEVGVSWVLVTGWIDDLDAVIDAIPLRTN